MSSTIDAIAFALGGVLLDWNPHHLYRSLLGDEREATRFLDEVCTPAWRRLQDEGRPVAEGVAELVARHPERADLIRAYYERFDEMLAPNDDTIALVEQLLASGRRILAIANGSVETFPAVRRALPLLDRFDGIVLSGEERVAKPDPRIFEILLARHDLEAGRVLFVDDVDAHVAAAATVGLRAVRFTGAEMLGFQLRGIGLC